MQTLDWENMLANLNEEKPEDAHFTCIECGATIEEHHRAKWPARENGAPKSEGKATSSLVLPLVDHLGVAELGARRPEWLNAKGDLPPSRRSSTTRSARPMSLPARRRPGKPCATGA